MVRVILETASRIDGNMERIRNYLYCVDGDTENTQGTLRDNRRAEEIMGHILAGSPSLIKGQPPDDAKPIFFVWLDIINAHGMKANHRCDFKRIDCSARYNIAVGKAMEFFNHLKTILDRATKLSRIEKAPRLARKKQRRKETREMLKEMGEDAK